MKVIIAGGRDFVRWQLLVDRCDYYLSKVREDVEIVQGGARGADALGKQYAIERGLPWKVFPADWKTNGKAAGPLRNREMAEYADCLIAFWDGESRGTKHMIETMKALGKTVKIVYYINY